MKVRGDNAPSNAFTLEEQPKKPGYVLARFYENAQEFTDTQGDLTISGWEYDEYRLELAQYDGMEEDILAGYDGYLAQAKLLEAEENAIPTLKGQIATLEEEKAALTEQVSTLEEQVTDTQIALCDVYEQVISASLAGEV